MAIPSGGKAGVSSVQSNTVKTSRAVVKCHLQRLITPHRRQIQKTLSFSGSRSFVIIADCKQRAPPWAWLYSTKLLEKSCLTCFGSNLLSQIDRVVLAQRSQVVIHFEGVNDIGKANATFKNKMPLRQASLHTTRLSLEFMDPANSNLRCHYYTIRRL